MKKKFLLTAIFASLLLCACNAMVDVSYPLPEGNVSEVTLSSSLLSLTVGDSAFLDARVQADSEYEIAWLNSNPGVASLSYNGTSATVSAIDTGETYISVIAGAKSASCKVVVSRKASTTISLNPTSKEINVGDRFDVIASVTNGDSTQISWASSDNTVVSFNGAGNVVNVVGVSSGEASISASLNGAKATCYIKVNAGQVDPGVVITGLELNNTNREISVGDDLEIVAKVSYTGSPTPYVTWTNENEEVASSVISNNTITLKGLKAGSTKVTASINEFNAICEVKVTEQEAYFVRLSKSTISLVEGQSDTLKTTTNPSDAVVSWLSSNPSVAKVDNGKVEALKAGTADISASITVEDVVYTDVCKVSVTSNAEQEDYAKKVSAWSKKGHVYFHYLRNTDTDYSKWALWLWNSYPVDDEGVLYAANPNSYDLKNVTPHTIGYMTNAECGGSGNDVYSDEYGQIIDVDLAEEGLVGGKTGKPIELISGWEQDELNKNNIGFLIVDQSKMTGDTMWVSDGGAEVYIKKIGKHLENGKESYLHVYCVEGSVADYKLASGKQTVINPTLTDDTGKYRSNNDVTDLRKDGFPGGVATSWSFKEDRPGVGYQIFVPSFADSDGDGFGDLQGIIGKLDYLESLGVDVLWLTPIQESNSYHGYDVTDYYKIDSRFGTLKDYQELLYKAHERGMKVLMDMVINHTSKSNVLYKKSQRAEVEEINGKTINYRDMYLWKYKGDKVRVWDEQDPTTSEGIQHANFVTKNVEDVSDWYRDGTSNYYYFGKFGSGMAELNYSSSATREYMTDMCKYWLSFGLDGFRLDAIKHIYLLAELDPAVSLGSDFITYDVGWKHYYNPEMGKEIDVPNDYSYDRNLNVLFWKQFAGTIKSAYPDCFLVGENFDGWNARMAPFYEAIDSQFDFQTYYALNEVKEDAIGDKVRSSLQIYSSYRGNDVTINGAFTSNHDVARMLNHCAAHDDDVAQAYAGNPGGVKHHKEIDANNWNYALKQARYYSAISILTPGVSWIYYGDEIGLCGNTADKVPDSTGHIVDDHGNNVDRWYRQPMRWSDEYGKDNVVKYQFSGMEVLWDKISNQTSPVPVQEVDSNSLLSYFKCLTAAKRSKDYPTFGWVVNSGSVGGQSGTTQMQISDGTRSAIVAINNNDSDVTFEYMGYKSVIGKSNNTVVDGKYLTMKGRGFVVIAL